MSGILKILAVLLICLPQVALALELFGVALETTSRDELRAAVKQTGIETIQEAGEEQWYDVYDSSAVLDGSSRLYLGFVKADQGFAFAEYEFPGIDASHLLQRLKLKYGDADADAGRYMSDRSYRWQRDGIEIKLISDWKNYRTRLSYIDSSNLATLQAEQSAAIAENKETAASLF